MVRKFYFTLAVFILTLSFGVGALGLGEIKLQSGLNQPLKAQIELFSPEGLSEYEVAASLASMAEFEKAGIDYFTFLKSLKFKTVAKEGERLIVEVTTRQPVKEPFLNFLVELNWPKGRMLREYTLLLDPPVFSQSTASVVSNASASPSKTVQKTTKTQKSATKPAQPRFEGRTFGPVGETDTLWSIATRVRPADATIHQTLVALFKANPDAFMNNDINMLKRGAQLAIPDAESIAKTPHRAALQDMVARTRSGSRESVLDTSSRSSNANEVTRGQDRLRLSAPKGGDNGNNASSSGNAQVVNELKQQLSEQKEATATLASENEELRKQLQLALEKIEQNQTGVKLESETAAALANRESVNEKAEAIAEAGQVDEVSEDASTPLSSAQNTSEIGAIQPETNASQNASETSSQAANTPSTSSSVVTDNKKPTVTTTTLPPPEKGFFDEPLMLYGSIGLLVLLLGALGVFWKMRQRMSEDEFQDDLVVSAQGGAFDTEVGLDLPNVGDELLDELESETIFEEDSTEADPLGEADIYIAYGKYDQAESLLEKAINEDPERNDLKVKLLECFAEQSDSARFEAKLSDYLELPNFAMDAESQAQVNDLRDSAFPSSQGVEDDFELPSTEGIFGDSNEGLDNDDFSLDDLDTESDVKLDASVPDFEETREFDTDDLDFDLDETDTGAKEANEDDAFSLDDDLLTLEDDNDFDIASESTDDDRSIDKFSLDESDLSALEDDIVGTTEDTLDINLDDDMDLDFTEDFDLEADELGSDEDIMDGADEASTKLDLARAYIDMGDSDGAKEILNEVIEEGGEAHKNEALSLLEKL